MRWYARFVAAFLGILGANSLRIFFSKYQVIILDKEDILEDEEDQMSAMDLRGTPTHVCICGSNQFFIRATFENYEISSYFLDMQCVNCGSLATAPTPVDREEMEN